MLQCVEQNLIGLDDDISTTLHELKYLQILVGINDDTGEPILKKSEEGMTLR